MSAHLLPALAALLVLLSAAPKALAGGAEVDDPPAKATEIRRETTSGPVKAVVTVAPERPLLGDALTLSLEVTAEPGIEVRMPAFGEALGRFEIVDFTPRERRTPAGGVEASQRYTLDLPMSGKHTIPSLAVEFVDRRGGGGPVAPSAATVSARARAEPQELLTEPITIDVETALPDGAVTATAALRPPRDRLDEAWPPPEPGRSSLVWALAGALALALGVVAWRRGSRGPTPTSAFETAVAALAALAAKGAPAGDAIDAWYVALSAVVRRYVEDRYGLRAPELTTEEFMREAFRSQAIQVEHRPLLRGFLERCDRVKFAAYRPTEAESLEALAAAQRFVHESRPTETSTQATVATPPSTADAGARPAGGAP